MPPVIDPKKELVDLAHRFVGVKESGGDNKGKEVEAFQKAVDGKAQGESWCMCFVQHCIKEIELTTGLKSDIFKSEHCMTVWNNTPVSSRLKDPEPGCIVIWNFVGTASGHTGIVTKVGDRLETIEGNTSDGAGIVREGDGVYVRSRSKTGDVKMKVVGFLRSFA